MRSVLTKAITVVLITFMAFGLAAPIAAAQDYPPVSPILEGDGITNFTGDELLFLINGNDFATTGDVANATAVLNAAKRAGADPAVIARLEALVNRAKAVAAAKAPASAPAVSVPVPNLAFTGSSANLPAALGAALIGAGGLTVLFARKRELAQA